MCGIVGYIGKEKCIPIIIDGLKKLEYRGYDSSGIAYFNNGKIFINKESGRIENLEKSLNFNEESYLGIGHTRWATHGSTNKINSHPHKVGKITLVHNGIIENYDSLKEELKDYELISETDSEVVAALIDSLLKKENDMLKVLNMLKDYLVGSYALGIMIEGEDRFYAIRKDSPLIIGVSKEGNFIASDVPAILNYTDKYYLLENDEYACLEKENVLIYSDGIEIKKSINIFTGDLDNENINNYDHFMLKEIYEQPKIIKDIVSEYAGSIDKLNKLFNGLEDYEGIDIVGCGSSYHAGLVGKYLILKYGKVNVNTDIASEYRYCEHIYSKKHLVILISQSGETADTLAVLRKVKKENVDTLAIVNVFCSSMAREADKVVYIKAGSEVSVATTKAYSAQVMMLILLAVYLGIKKGTLQINILEEFKIFSNYLENILKDTNDCMEVANLIHNKKDIFFLGRQIDYFLCMEASLKLKEISYIHSEAYAAGELKHGTISFIEENVPVISIITDDSIRLKILSNIKEVCARGALSIIISNEKIIDLGLYSKLILIPKVSEFLDPILAIIKCQLIAYYVAKLKDCDIDKPRNLAKSVTVE